MSDAVLAGQAVVRSDVRLPRVAITYCTKCKWLLRAAYFAQELLSTFETKIGEVALLPTVGGIFEVKLSFEREGETVEELLWDFKSKRCFPETKILKQLVRNHIDPERSLGHSDKPSSARGAGEQAAVDPLLQQAQAPGAVAPAERSTRSANDPPCEDCG